MPQGLRNNTTATPLAATVEPERPSRWQCPVWRFAVAPAFLAAELSLLAKTSLERRPTAVHVYRAQSLHRRRPH